MEEEYENTLCVEPCEELSEEEYEILMMYKMYIRIGMSMYFVVNLYIQKLLFGAPISNFTILTEKSKKKKLKKSNFFKLCGSKCLCSFGNTKVDKEIKFDIFHSKLMSECIAIFILLKSKRDDIVISKVRCETLIYTEIIIPEDKYFLEYYKGYNILCIICDDNIESKESFRNYKNIMENHKVPEYIKKLYPYFMIEISDDNGNIVSINNDIVCLYV